MTPKIILPQRVALAPVKPAAPETHRSASRGASFSEILAESIQKVNHLQKEADEAIEGLATQSQPDIARTMVAVEKASLSFKMLTRVRSEMIEAYEEIMRMTA